MTTTTKICLRCDWSGDQRDPACPVCGTALFLQAGSPEHGRPRRRGRRRSRRASPSASPGAPGASPDPSQAAPPDPPVRERRRSLLGGPRPGPDPRDESQRKGVIATVVVLMLAVVVVAVVVRSTPSSRDGQPPASGPVDGILVYVATGDDGVETLWLWDLVAGTVTEGPRVPDAVELLDAYRAGSGWIGIRSVAGDGTEKASYLRHYDPTDLPTVVAEGDLVSWSAGGLSATSATMTPIEGERCDRLTIRVVLLSVRLDGSRFDQPLCGELLALHRDAIDPHIGYADGTTKVATVGNGHLFRDATGVTLFGAAPSGELLVLPVACSEVATEGIVPCTGLTLVSRTRQLIPYGSATDRLTPRRVITWTRGGGAAFVTGTYQGVSGIYLVEIGASGGGREPRRLRPTLVRVTSDPDTSVAELLDGRLLVADSGRVYLVDDAGDGDLDHGSTELNLPQDAPSPSGPIVWMRALPSSAL